MEKSRVELFELVWSMPMTHLSRELGLSDVWPRGIEITLSFLFCGKESPNTPWKIKQDT